MHQRIKIGLSREKLFEVSSLKALFDCIERNIENCSLSCIIDG